MVETVPERIEAALLQVGQKFDQLREAMHARTEHFTRILLALGVIVIFQLIVLCVILSAVMPGWPILRIYERNEKRTAGVVVALNQQHCEILSSLGKSCVLPPPAKGQK